jgi:glutamate carboxypeptidase
MSVNSSSERQIKRLREWVEINSGTANTAGVNRMIDGVAQEASNSGLSVRRLSHPGGADKSGDLLIAESRGNLESARWITLVTHADTVFEPEHGFTGFKLSKDGKYARGPGVIDDKGGILIALEGARRFIASAVGPRRSVRLICTPSEETGSPGWHEELQRISHDSMMILGFEPAQEDGSITESRRGNRWYDIEVKGRAAHAGRAHKEGINAAHELAIKLDRLQNLTDYSRDVTVSIGSVQAGDGKFNIVCERASAKIDARFPDFDSRDELHRKIETILCEKHAHSRVTGEHAQTSYSIADDCPPFAVSVESRSFVDGYQRILSALEGGTVRAVRSGGAADCNYMSRRGLIVLDGLGAKGGGMHTTGEFIELSSLETRSEALARFLMTCGRG